MTNNKTRIISVILTVLLLLSALPIVASAADPIKLSLSDPLVKMEPPTVSPSEAEYGIKYGELTFTGGAMYYDGQQVPGKFAAYEGYEDIEIFITESEEDKFVYFGFIPDDQTAYKTANYSYNAEYGIENWPTVEISPLKVKAEGTFAEMTADMGSLLSTLSIPKDQVIIYDAKTGEVPSGRARWQWYNTNDESVASTILVESGEYPVRWRLSNYEYYYTTIKINVNKTDYTGAGTLPTVTAPEAYTAGMTYADLTVTGGTAYYLGEVVPGHYEVAAPTTDMGDYLGKTASVAVKFIPDDESLASYFTNNVNVKVQMPPLLKIELTDDCDAMRIEIGQFYKTMRGDRAGLTFKNGLDGGYVSVKFTDSYSNSPVGFYGDVTVTLECKTLSGYETKTITLPLYIIPTYTDDVFGKVQANAIPGGAEGAFDIGVQFSDAGKTGTVTIRVNGETIAKNIAPTYADGETAKWKFVQYTAASSGTYNVEAEYIAGDNDGYTYRNPIITTSFEATVRTERKITVGENIRLADTVYYGGDRATVEFTGNSDTFGGWEIKDATGKVYTAAELSGTEYTVREEQMSMTKLTFVIPDCDITVTAKSKTIIPTVPGDDGFDFASIWASIVEFFTGLKDMPVISWLARLFELIWAFVTGFINGLAE